MSKDATPTSAVEFFDSGAAKYEHSTGACTRDVAKSLLQLPILQDFPAGSVLLDNACGTAIVAEEIILRCKRSGRPVPEIRAVDPAENMVAMAQQKISTLGAGGTCKVMAMPGEKLDFPNGSFTHSVTNMGILFFKDGAAGAKEIYRTLKPGSVAVVTSWSDLGYLKGVIQPAQKEARPNDVPFVLPISQDWFKPSHVKKVLEEDGGFKKVEIQEVVAHYGASSLAELQDMLLTIFTQLWSNWSDEEKTTFKAAMAKRLEAVAEPYTKPSGEPGLGIRMKAIVAVCQK
ncbi:methyltransferase type 11 [Pochonia chlamydosporia 170]|uniref:Methyltransferase type 11 n=1 Tax=Pochonia chlamydosporia 170 TaxID=1380566 RepID=A0A179FZX2_METCM|nr:methyltransferase type 11 [Pochonia chlamydosporia 170]OAQ70778.1 methyltransferase type 11 [Pochonia chlamydosporia 170]